MANEIARRLRRNRTGAESKLWSRLRQLKGVGLSDERQRDKDREDFLITQGFRVVRLSNEDVLQNLDGVMDMIVHALNMPPPPHSLPARGRVKLEPNRQ